MKFFRYKLPFKQPFRTSRKCFTNREGFILQCDYLAFSCYGDAAPLPGFSKESLAEVNDQISHYQNTLDRYFMQDKGYADWKSFAESLDLYPSLRFGLDTFLFDRLAKKRGIALNKHFSSESIDAIPINVALGIGSAEKTIDQCKSYWSEGFRNFKIKVGADFDLALSTIKQVRKIFPKSNIRIDPNQSWSMDEAIDHLQQLSSFHIEFCEQPVDSENIEGLAEVRHATEIPIAADEAVRDLQSMQSVIDHEAADILIIKPMLIGSFDIIFQLVKQATAHNMESVFTTSIESGVGRLATAHLTSFLGSRKYAHGLATGYYFENDIIYDKECISSGNYNLPENRGIGLDPESESGELLKLGVS